MGHFSSFDSDFAKNGAFFKFDQRFCEKLGIFQVPTAILPKMEHSSNMISEFAKNGAFLKFRQRFYQKWGIFQI